MTRNLKLFLTLCLFALAPLKLYATTITLEWDKQNDSDLAGFNLYYATFSFQDPPVLAAGNQLVSKITINDPATNYYKLVAPLTEQTSYFLKLTAFNNIGAESFFSNETSSYVPKAPDTAAPSMPAGLVAVAVSSTQVNLSWTASTDNIGVAGYKIFRNGAQIGTSGSNLFLSTGLIAGTAYSYTVSAYDAAGNNSTQSAASGVMTASSSTFYGDWESGILTGTGNHNWGSVERVATDRYTLLNDGGGRQGSYYARVEVRSGDDPISTGSTERAEVSAMNNVGTTWWRDQIFENAYSGTQQYSFSVKFDSTWQTITDIAGTGAWGIFLQLHGPSTSEGGGINPVWALSATDKIYLNLKAGDMGSAAAKITSYALTDGALNPGQWIDLVLTVKYAKDSTGFITLMRRNAGETAFRQVLNIQNTPTLQYNSGINGGTAGGHYMKHGLYRNAQPFTSILYLDGFTRSALGVNIDTVLPSVPAGLSAVAISSAAISLTWSATYDNVEVTGYKIYRSGTQIGTSTTTSFLHSGLAANTAYSYTVAAYDAAGNNSAQSASASATTLPPPAIYYVSPSGSDSYTTAQAQNIATPWKGIGSSIGKLKAGDTLYVRGGTYIETGTIVISVSGTENAPINIAAYPGDSRPILDRNYFIGADGKGGLIWVTGSHLNFSGLEIIHSNMSGMDLVGHEITLSNMNIHHNQSSAVYVRGSSNTIQDSQIYENCFMNCRYNKVAPDCPQGTGLYNGAIIMNVGWPAAISVNSKSYGNTLRRSQMYNNWGEGINTWDGTTGTLIEDNVFYDNWSVNIYLDTAVNVMVRRNLSYFTPGNAFNGKSQSTFLTSNESNTLHPSSDNTIINNLFMGAPVGLFSWTLYGSLLNVQFANNTLINAQLNTSAYGGSGNRITNNILAGGASVPQAAGITWGNNLWLSAAARPALAVGTGDIVGDPILTKTGATAAGQLTAEYFKINSSTSPAINKGAYLTNILSDYFNTSRSNPPDIGAHEYYPTVDATAPSVPGGLAAVAVSSTQINLSWTASTDNVGVTGYRLDVSTSSGFGSFVTGYNNLNVGNVLAKSVTGLSASTQYYARVRAYDAAGNSSVASASVSAITLALPGPAIYYVSPSGNNANPGTLASPWGTIAYAVPKLKAGDTLYARGGVYKEWGIKVSAIGSLQSPVKILAYPGESPVMDGPGLSTTTQYNDCFWLAGQYIQVSGFEIRNGGRGIWVTGMHNTVSSVYVHDVMNQGVFSGLGGDFTLIENSTVAAACLSNYNAAIAANPSWAFGIGTWISYNINAAISSVTIRGNVVHDNWGEGIQTDQSDGALVENNVVYDNWATNTYIEASYNTIYRNNLVYNTPNNIVGKRSNGLTLAEENPLNPNSYNNIVVNNVFYNADVCAHCWTKVAGSGLNNVLIANNTILGSFTTGGPGNNVVNVSANIVNNIVTGTVTVPSVSGLFFKSNLWLNAPPALAAGTGDVTGDPQLKQTGQTGPGMLSLEYFKLNSTSPAIDKGTVVFGVTVDIFQTPRSSLPDIGAYEYTGLPADTGAPSVPGGLAAVAVSSTQLNLSWTASTDNVGVTGYRLDVSTSSGFGSFVAGYNNLNVGNVLAKSVTGLSASTQYYARVRAYDAAGNSSVASASVNATTLGALSGPAGKIEAESFSAKTGSVVALIFSSVDASNGAFAGHTANGDTLVYNNIDLAGISALRLRIATPLTGSSIELRSGSATGALLGSGSLPNTGGWAGTGYWQETLLPVTGASGVRNVWLILKGGTSGVADIDWLRFEADISSPTVPMGLYASAVSTTGFTLGWTVASDNIAVAGYKLDVALDSGFSSLVIGYNNLDIGTVTSMVINSLSAGTRYFARLRAYDAGGNISAYSASASTVTLAAQDTTAPSAPTDVAAIAVSSVQINMSWTASSDNVGVTGYKIYRAGVQVGTSTSNAFINSGLSASTAYSYTVSAYDAAGNNSGQSVSATATTLAAPDTQKPVVSITQPQNGMNVVSKASVYMSATDNVGVSRLELYIDGVLKASYSSASAKYTWNLSGLSGTHTLQARAYDATGNIGVSSTAAVNVKHEFNFYEVIVSSLPMSSETVITAPVPAGSVQVTVSAATFSEPVVMSINSLTLVGASYGIMAKSAQAMTLSGFDVSIDKQLDPLKPYQLTLTYSDAAVAGFDRSSLVLSAFDADTQAWVGLESVNDPGTNKVRAYTNKLGTFWIMGTRIAAAPGNAKVYPNPFYPGKGQTQVTFSGLAQGTEIVIYTLAGEQVWKGTADVSGLVMWTGRNKAGNVVASGLYLAHIKSGNVKKIVKLSVIK